MYRKIYEKSKIFKLESDAEQEIYVLIDKNLRQLPRKSDGTFDTDSKEFQHNEVDALRHSYVSGVFVIEYNVRVAKFLGNMRELFGSSTGGELKRQSKIRNMDYWNNDVGRKYGKISKNSKELYKHLVKALKNGELIVSLNDPREYSVNEKPIDASVIVLKESETGENQLFLDIKKMLILSKEEFVSKIKNKEYGEEYEVRTIDGKEIPASKRDGKNNLG